MLDFEPFILLDIAAEDVDFSSGREERLVAAAVFIIDELANDLPFIEVENVTAINVVGMAQAVQNKSERLAEISKWSGTCTYS